MSEDVKKFRCRSRVLKETCNFEWSIENFQSICSAKTQDKKNLESEKFTTGESSLETGWYIDLDFTNNDTIGVCLKRFSNKSLRHYVIFSFSIVGSNKIKYRTRNGKGDLYHDYSNGFGFVNFIDRLKLFKKDQLLLPNDTLTIVCEFQVVSVIDASIVSKLTQELTEDTNYTMIRSENVKKLRCCTQLLKEAGNFEWSIKNFVSICSEKKQDKECLFSETFTTGESSLETKWYIELEFTNFDTIGVYLTRLSNKSLRHYVTDSVSIFVYDKKYYNYQDNKGILYNSSSYHNSLGYDNFINRKKLFEFSSFNNLIRLLLVQPNDTLTIVYEFNISVIDASIVSELTQDSTSVFKNPDSLMDDLQHLYTNQMFSDFTIKVGDEELKCHKNILCARSSVFNTMLTTVMKENLTNCLEITDFDRSIVKTMIHYIYCGQVQDFSPELSIKLYSIADKYNLQDLKDICVEYILENPDSLMDDLQHMYTSQMFSDFTLKVGDEELKVHKLILCARSSVFNIMLNCDMKENRTTAWK
ncbi:hypothetical protein JTE90_002119 [Oedothorax gibbosus]|uniref:Speckle-type POZ protein n=1 Tax=Oedothorax gibbosus TaxID=931172 RepID=A0AAV6V9I4_9ARAC|nr:hypothetical protein JTE90_002119 [Oedothorax gibbosus]